MATSNEADAESRAFVHWLQGIKQAGLLDEAVSSLGDVCDGSILFDALRHVDPEHFRKPHQDEPDNVVLRIGTLKRLYKLMIQYIAENLQLSPAGLDEPDFDALARISAGSEARKMCRLALVIAVQSESKMDYIQVIQTLEQTDQQQLMHSIEATRSCLEPARTEGEDEPFEQRAREASTESADANGSTSTNGELAIAHRKLLVEHEARGAAMAALEEGLAQARRELEAASQSKASESPQDHAKCGEVARLSEDLRKCEDALASAEAEIDRLQTQVRERERMHEEAVRKAKDFDTVKDQLDELKHVSEKLQKAESVIDKYKKKLEETADVRRKMKDLEDQNAQLIDRITTLQEDQSRANNLKPLMESYKAQVLELETKASMLQKDLDAERFAKDQISQRLRTEEAAHRSHKEELELYQERVKELEGGHGKSSSSDPSAGLKNGHSEASDSLPVLDEELEDALAGTSTTELKIQLRRLKRERDAAMANKADVSRILMLENLLDDAQHMKERYETDYLKEHQAKLVLQRQLDEIQSGRSRGGDGPEANAALRIRLGEVVESLDRSRKELAELQVQHDAQSADLAIARSDLSLVNQDQVEVLHQLRASVRIEKEELEEEARRLRAQLKDAQDGSAMLMQQINGLLMDKIDLQSQSIGQRDEALRRERNLGDLRASLAGKALPKEAEDLIATLTNAQASSEAQAKALQEKLGKARAFIRQQDQMLKERPRSEEAPQVDALEQELRLMASAFQNVSLRLAQELHSSSRGRRANVLRSSSAWMGQQRRAAAARLIEGR